MSLLLCCQLHYNALLTLLPKCGEWSYTICSSMHSKIHCVCWTSIIVENPRWSGSFSFLPWMTGILPVYSCFTLQIIFICKETYSHLFSFLQLKNISKRFKGKQIILYSHYSIQYPDFSLLFRISLRNVYCWERIDDKDIQVCEFESNILIIPFFLVKTNEATIPYAIFAIQFYSLLERSTLCFTTPEFSFWSLSIEYITKCEIVSKWIYEEYEPLWLLWNESPQQSKRLWRKVDGRL